MKYGPGKDILVILYSTEPSQSHFKRCTLKKYIICTCLSEQAKVLRLLATVYLEWDCKEFQEKMLNAVNLANKVGWRKDFHFVAEIYI